MTTFFHQRFRAVLLTLCVPIALSFGQSKTGTTVGQFLLIEPSARITGMGNAGVTVFDEASSAFYNPAALGHASSSDAQFTHSSWLADISYNYAIAAVRISGSSSLALSVTSLNSGEIAVRTVEQPLGTGERYTVANTAIGLGYGQRITDRFSAGVIVSYVQERIWHSALSAFGVSFGTIYQITSDGLQLGASLSNFGTRAQYDGSDLRIRYDFDPTRYGDNSSIPSEILTDAYSLPVVFRVGFGYPITINDDNTIHLAVDAFHPSDNSESISMGAEYVFMKTFALRGGYQHLFQIDSELGLTLGAG
ncbi:MAG TPA: PorV/PorQ family protein, partial [Bacteroidota bacterium]|nr:PorV/PorQ family protein [Bacteroidota bacterium]